MSWLLSILLQFSCRKKPRLACNILKMLASHSSMEHTTSPKFHLMVLTAAVECKGDIAIMEQKYQPQPKADTIFFSRTWSVMDKKL